MFISRLSALAVTLAVAGTVPLAAGTDPVELMESSYIKVVAALGGGKADFKDHLVILASPGIPIDNAFSMSKMEDRKTLQILFDQVPKARPVYQVNGSSTYSSVLKKVLLNKVTPPPKPLTPEMKAAFLDATNTTNTEDFLGPKVTPYKQFRHAEDVYGEAEDAYLDALYDVSMKRIRAVPTKVQLARDTAYEDLHKLQVKRDAALDVIRQVNAMGGNAWWQSLDKRFRDGTDKETQHQTVEFYPKPETWHVLNPADKGWTHIEIKCSEMKSDTEYHKMAVDAHLGWQSSWSLDINASWSKETLDIVKNDKDATISFDVKRVAVMRTWFPEVADDQNWGWNDGKLSYGSILLNAGHADDKDGKVRPQLPTYVNEVYVGRNFVLKAKAKDETYNKFKEDLDASLGLSVCGFTLGGSFAKHDMTEKVTKWEGGFTLTHPGAEIMAFGAAILPLSPAGTPESVRTGRKPAK